MSDPAFTPVLYLKDKCPHCLKARLFLLEAGLLGDFQVREFVPGTPDEQAIKAELAPHFAKPSFPTVQTAPGAYLNESDDIIAHYAREAGVDPAGMPVLRAYVTGAYARLKAMREEINALKDKAAA